MVGVIGHVANPTPTQSVELARNAERAGAGWIGFADAFWWRDVWMTLLRVADATSTIEIGPAMTNPYLRHPFHTVSALATLQEAAPGRVFAGITAGGSEVSAAAGRSRRDAPERVRALVDLIRRVEDGSPLDDESGRGLDLDLGPVPLLIAGRGSEMLRVAGSVADRVLLWAIPDSDLERTVDVIMSEASGRERPPQLVWAPLIEHDETSRRSIMQVAVYASLNSRRDVRAGWVSMTSSSDGSEPNWCGVAPRRRRRWCRRRRWPTSWSAMGTPNTSRRVLARSASTRSRCPASASNPSAIT